MPEGMNSRPEHLREAVVAKVCHSGGHVKSEKSFCKSLQTLLTSEKYPETSSHTTPYALDSENYSIDEPSMRGEDTQQERLSGAAKNNKKRARPRPRDRQLIQDRIKELREQSAHVISSKYHHACR